MAYAEGTAMPVEKTVAEIAKLVRARGGIRFAQLDDQDQFVVAFTMAERQVRFIVRYPAPDDPAYAVVATNATSSRATTKAEREAKWEARRRQRMRALMLVIKAKLESVDSEVETFEEAFLANVVMSDGVTVYERAQAPIAEEYRLGRPVLMLESKAAGDRP